MPSPRCYDCEEPSTPRRVLIGVNLEGVPVIPGQETAHFHASCLPAAFVKPVKKARAK